MFTNRAISYRKEKGFDDLEVALSVGIQKMVRSDRASAGVMFSIDTETGFPDAAIITAAWGLGENIENVDTSGKERQAFVLSKVEILQLARWAIAIESHYGKPMDMEWAKDGDTEELYIVQARPETVQSQKSASSLKHIS